MGNEMNKHDLYTDADKTRPDAICDRNGQVSLGLCKRCGKGESELAEPCAPAAPDLDDMSGAHHLTPESIAATIADLRAIEDGTTERPVQGRDWRTWAGVLARIMERLAAPAAPDMFDTSDERLIQHYATESLVQDLDVLVHGVPTGASLSDLVETLRSRQSVQILKLEDGMRVNFRAPDGRRTTMFLDVVVDDFARTGRTASELAKTMRAAIEAYPVAGSTPC